MKGITNMNEMNVEVFYKTLMTILERKHNVKITYTLTKKDHSNEEKNICNNNCD